MFGQGPNAVVPETLPAPLGVPVKIGDIMRCVETALRDPAEAQKLPCDVHLPPNTYIRKGCPVSTLMTAIGRREGRPDSDTTFPRPAATESERLEEEIAQLEGGFTGQPFSDGLRRDKIDGLKAKLAALHDDNGEKRS